jgi:aldose 1-epimerase
VDGNKLILSYHSADLEEGYPGDLVVHTIFELTDSNEFLVEFKATTTKPTYVNLTNHSYFNLAGHNAGAAELYKHVVCINADQITDVDEDSIPTGILQTLTITDQKHVAFQESYCLLLIQFLIYEFPKFWEI